MESKLLEQTQYCSLADVAGKFFFLEICQIEITCLIQLVSETYVVELSKHTGIKPGGEQIGFTDLQLFKKMTQVAINTS